MFEIGKDWRGTPLHVGSTIVYPSRHSSSVWMTEATIEMIYMVHDKVTKLVVRRTRMTRRWATEIVRPLVTLHNVMDVTVMAPPLRSRVGHRDWSNVRSGMKV